MSDQPLYLFKTARLGLLAFTLSAGAIACRTAGVEDPIPGVYHLEVYDGHDVPWERVEIFDVCRTPPGQPNTCPPPRPTGCYIVVDGGRMRLEAAGRFLIRWRSVNSCTGEVTQESGWEGTYSVGPEGALHFTKRGPAPLEGRISDGRIRVWSGDFWMLFER